MTGSRPPPSDDMPAFLQSNETAATYRRSDQVSDHRVGESTYLIDTRSNAIHRLDAIGAALWFQLADTRSIEELVAILHAAFHEVDRKVIEEDVSDLIRELLDAGLITQVK
jgi:hypothetical protein